jgi:multidrug efflux pump subunit AcrB
MTDLSAGLAFVPVVLADSEPMGVVILGRVLTSTALNMLLAPPSTPASPSKRRIAE